MFLIIWQRQDAMHTFRGSDGTSFHYNSDFSAEVIIEGGFGEVRISGDVVLEFIARAYCLPAKISLLEEIGADSDARIRELREAPKEALLLGTV